MPRTFAEDLLRTVPVLGIDETVGDAVRKIVAAKVPALPIASADGKFWGIFGEREFVGAIFPAYFDQLRYAGFVPHSLDADIEQRAGCMNQEVGELANRERISVDAEYSDAQLAETFLHHRVLIVPVLGEGRKVLGVVTRSDFFAAMAARLEAAQPDPD